MVVELGGSFAGFLLVYHVFFTHINKIIFFVTHLRAILSFSYIKYMKTYSTQIEHPV